MVEVSGEELYQWRNQSIELAIAADVPSKEVDWLLQKVTTLDALHLRLGTFKKKPSIKLSNSLPQLTELWQKRVEDRLPVQYLVGRSFWRDWEFKVSQQVLIPRPETELVIDIIQNVVRDPLQQENISQQQETHWVDLGTGSGAIAIGLATCLPTAIVHAVDISDQALKIAQENAQIAQLSAKIIFYQGNWWQPLQQLQGKVAGMVSNPPYIPTAELPHLQPEVFLHEPHLALDGGEDGLAAIRYLIAESPKYLVSGGIWLIEIMAGQAQAVTKLLKDQSEYEQVEIIPDLAGIERFILAHRV